MLVRPAAFRLSQTFLSRWRRTARDYDIHPLGDVDARNVRICPQLRASGYELLSRSGTAGDALLTSGRVNHALFSGISGDLTIQRATFRAGHPAAVGHVLLREFAKKKQGSMLFNAKKVRLVSDPLLADGSVVFSATHIQPTHYFDTLMTNDALGISLRSDRDRRTAFDGHDFCFPGNEVPGCDQSACANQLGASTIAVTSDDYFVVVGQSSPNAFSQRQWTPSGSGSADWKDVRQAADLQQFVQSFAKRELTEECGLAADDVAWLRIIGYGRLLHRGGLPQFFCLARLGCTFDRVRITRSERPLIDYHTHVNYRYQGSHHDAIRETMNELRANDGNLSSVLWWCFELLSRLPEADLEKAFD